MTDAAEEAYWRFDARRRGYGEWKETPQSERDAFKSEFPALQAYALELKAIAERMEHSRGCASMRSYFAQVPGGLSSLRFGDCNCPLGELRAKLGEITDG